MAWLVALGFLALQVATVTAVDFTWNTGSNGDFDDAANWSPFGGPPNASNDSASFNLAASYFVDFDDHFTNSRLVVSRGDVTLGISSGVSPFISSHVYTLQSGSGDSVVVGSIAGPLASLTTLRGVINTDRPLRIGRVGGSNGRVTLLGTSWTSALATVVGSSGNGELVISSGSLSDAAATLGLFGGVMGSATVAGNWTNATTMNVGNSGIGTLDIEGSGLVTTNGDGRIAVNGGSTGTVTVGGTDARWMNNASLYVGGSSTGAGGTGLLDINPGGTVSVVNTFVLRPSGTTNLAGGTLSAGSVDLNAGAFSWTNGTFELTNDDLAVKDTGPLGAIADVGVDKSLIVSGELSVGKVLDGTLSASGGGTIQSSTAAVGSTDPGAGNATINLTGGGSSWTISGDLNVGGAAVTDLSVLDGAVLSSQNAFVSNQASASATIVLTDALTRWDNSGDVFLGGNSLISLGSGQLGVQSGATLEVGGNLRIWDDFVVTVDAGQVLVDDLSIFGSMSVLNQTLDMGDGTLGVHDGGSLEAAVNGNSATQVTLQGTGSTWITTGSVLVGSGSSQPGLGEVGSLILAGGVLQADSIELIGANFSGFGELRGDVIAQGNVTATGDLTLGDSLSPTGLRLGGALNVGTHTVTVLKDGFLRVSPLVVIEGGTLAAPGGVALSPGDVISARGAINGRIAALAGAQLVASGDLSLGEASSAAGFFSDGELIVGVHTVTLEDSNLAVPGSLTSLGKNSSPGVLTATNGAVLDFGKNITGFGTVNTPDNPATPLINNGAIEGDSLAEPVTLSGYVKGVGTLDNVVITGTDAPGFSPSMVVRGSVSYHGTLEIELGGTSPGTDFDQIVHLLGAGTAELGGALEVRLIDGFAPSVGDTFEIITAVSVLNMFASEDFAAAPLSPGLGWQVNYNAMSVQLEVVSTLGAFETWIDTFPELTDPADKTREANPDGDRLNNLGEFALDGDPTAGRTPTKYVVKISTVSGVEVLTLTLAVRVGAVVDAGDPPGGPLVLAQLDDGVIYSLQATDDLLAFSLDVSEVTGADAAAIQAGLPAVNGGWEYRSFRSPGPVQGDPREFMNVQITNSPLP